jgi:hypothetical protein
MNYRHPRHRIEEIVKAPKCVSEGHVLDIEQRRGNGSKFDVPLDLINGPFCDMRYLERLQESRSALITAAVTGKIDVRKAPPKK